ncbi:MAG: hypothetical protein JWO89_1322 [Verrucomicrobiaceae bacterium]|nr:hypothetical protein [Verrucomicrobiaceae bacterium]
MDVPTTVLDLLQAAPTAGQLVKKLTGKTGANTVVTAANAP